MQGAWFCELFNAKTRTTGASLAYQLSAVVSGFTPLIATALYIGTGWVGPAILFSVYGLLGLVAALVTRETWGRAERDEVEALERAIKAEGTEPAPRRAPRTPAGADIDRRHQHTGEPRDATTTSPAATRDRSAIERVREAAYRIRRNALDMGEVQGQGYIGQALGVADVLAVVYTDQLHYRPEDPHWAGRDRFLLSIGHYAIALYAALAEAGIIPVEELETYGSDDSRLPMSGMASYTPGMEISGGSLGHGLAVATGMALGLRHQGNPARVFNLLSDGELDEGSTWEAAHADRPPRPGQRHRHRRRQRPAGRRPHRRRAAHRAGHRQVAGVRLARRCGSTATTSPRSSTPSTSCARTAARRRCSSATPASAAACRCSRPGRRRTSCGSTPHEWQTARDQLPRDSRPRTHR